MKPVAESTLSTAEEVAPVAGGSVAGAARV